MSLLGNIFWFILGGFALGLGYIFMGLIFCVTILGIPFGIQLMKIGVYCFCPFGKSTDIHSEQMGCLNIGLSVIWILIGGLELAISHLILGVAFCITIIGIPFGLQHFKIAKLALLPFGQH